MEFSHRPVLLFECIEGLAIKPDGVYVDCTLGGGGHSEEIAKRLKDGLLIGLDRDEEAIAAAGARLMPYGERVKLVNTNFTMLGDALDSAGVKEADGILFDLGVSSFQLSEASRGFSYNSDAPLDMRMDRKSPVTARDVVNDYEYEELERILREYGEERYSKRIAAEIVKIRVQKPIERTLELADIIKKSDAAPGAS